MKVILSGYLCLSNLYVGPTTIYCLYLLGLFQLFLQLRLLLLHFGLPLLKLLQLDLVFLELFQLGFVLCALHLQCFQLLLQVFDLSSHRFLLLRMDGWVEGRSGEDGLNVPRSLDLSWKITVFPDLSWGSKETLNQIPPPNSPDDNKCKLINQLFTPSIDFNLFPHRLNKNLTLKSRLIHSLYTLVYFISCPGWAMHHHHIIHRKIITKYWEGGPRVILPSCEFVSKLMPGIISMHVAIRKLYLFGTGRFHLVRQSQHGWNKCMWWKNRNKMMRWDLLAKGSHSGSSQMWHLIPCDYRTSWAYFIFRTLKWPPVVRDPPCLE